MDKHELIQLIFAFKVKFYRQEFGYSYQELSKRTGLSVSYLNDIERGKKYPKFDKINALAEAFDITYDYLVSTRAPKQVEPVIELLTSDFLELMASDSFGLDPYNLLNLLTTAPDRINILISALFSITKAYQMKSEHLYLTALRSYQALHNNYFQSVEEAVAKFREEYEFTDLPVKLKPLRKFFEKESGFTIETKWNKDSLFDRVRYYRKEDEKTVYINADILSEKQMKFIIAREIGFWYLKLEKRPVVFPLIETDDFDTIFNNFKASYFAVALLIPEKEMANELFELGQNAKWSPSLFEKMLNQFDVTPEMLLQRLTNILPKHFEIDNLFFLRLKQGKKDKNRFDITKELHLGRNHRPYANVVNEKYCRRWISITSIQQAKESTLAQISQYHETEFKYFCISMLGSGLPDSNISVTLGILMNEKSRSLFRFFGDPEVMTKSVHTTCERCSVKDCESRANAPVILQELEQKEQLLRLVKESKPK